MHKIKFTKLKSSLIPLLAFILSLIIPCIIVSMLGKNPLVFLRLLWKGAFGSANFFTLTLIKTTPLILTGLSVALGFRAGLFNIGAEGQLYMGGIIAAYLGCTLKGLPASLHISICLIFGFLLGALWGFIPGWLKAKRGVHEVINTIMLNYIAIYTTTALVRGPLSSGAYSLRTKEIAPSAFLPILWEKGPNTLSWGFMLALLCSLAAFFFLFRSIWGYEIRAVGLNADAAQRSGISVQNNIILTMSLCGGLAGLAGAIEVTGLHHCFYGQFSPGYGYDGIAVALLAKNHPLGVLITALFFGALRSSDRLLQLEGGIPKDIIIIIQALIIFFILSDKILRKEKWKKWINKIKPKSKKLTAEVNKL
jgi:ABC-type uncharacterized transport system permease subunit